MSSGLLATSGLNALGDAKFDGNSKADVEIWPDSPNVKIKIELKKWKAAGTR